MPIRFRRIAVILVVAAHFLLARTSESTSIIIYRSDKNIVVAADSRLTRADDAFVSDKACKITSSGNDIVIATGGLASKGEIDFTVEAKKIALSQKFDNQNDLDAIANSWAKLISSIYVNKIAPSRLKARRKENSHAIFLGYRNGNGMMSSVTVDLFWDTGEIPDIKVEPVEHFKPLVTGSLPISPLTEYDIETVRRLNDPTWNQIPQAYGVAAALANPKTVKDEENAVEKLTNLVGFWFPQVVGGDTDIALIEPGRPVSWPKQKDECKSQ